MKGSIAFALMAICLVIGGGAVYYGVPPKVEYKEVVVDDGYDSGYYDGYDDGYDNGYNDGYNKGVKAYYVGYDDGRSDGYNEGYKDGYKKGYNDGYNDGYNEGYNDGYNEGYKSVIIINTPEPIPEPTSEPELNCDYIWWYIQKVDNTDKNSYVPQIYDCDHFARDLIENLLEIGADAHLVAVAEDNGLHAIVMIFCSDGGILLVEPQTDEDVFSYYDRDGDGALEFYNENDVIYIEYDTGTLEWYGEKSDWLTDDGLIIVDMDYL